MKQFVTITSAIKNTIQNTKITQFDSYLPITPTLFFPNHLFTLKKTSSLSH